MEVFFFIIIFIIISVITHNSNQKTKEEWAKAAGKLKLKFTKGNPIGIISGRSQGKYIKIFTVNRGANNNKKTYTVFKINYKNPLPFTFSFTKQGVIQGLLKTFGAQDIEIGSPSFDRSVIVKGDDKEKIVNYLTPERQRIIKLLINQNTDTTISNRSIEIRYPNKIKLGSTIIKKMKMLERYVSVLTQERDTEASQKLAEKCKLKPQVLVTNTKDKEILIQEKTKTIKVTSSSNNESGDDKIPPPSVPSTQVIPPSTISINDCCYALFESNHGTQSMHHVFDSLYVGHQVEWKATLISAEQFSSDFIFKNCTGIKANFKLMEVGSRFGENEVMATVHFPDEELAFLKSNLNDKLAFSGKLLQLNPLVKTIFISEGSLDEK